MSSVMKALEAVKLPEEVIPSRLTPVLAIDSSNMANAIAELFRTVRQQHAVLEVMEKEATKRKIETEINTRNLRNEMEAKFTVEMKKRMADDERLRLEIKKEREESEERFKAVYESLIKSEEKLKLYVDKSVTHIRMSLKEHATRLGNLDEEVTQLNTRCKDVYKKTSESCLLLQVQVKKHHADQDHLYRLFNLTREDVASGNDTDRSQEVIAKVPLFQSMLQNNITNDLAIKGLTTSCNASAKTLVSSERRINELADKFEDVGVQRAKDYNEMNDRVRAAELCLQSKIEAVDIQSVKKAEAYTFVHKDELYGTVETLQNKQNTLDERSEYATMEREALAKELLKKSDWTALHDKVDKDEQRIQNHGTMQRLEAMQESLDDLQVELAAVKDNRPGKTQHGSTPVSPKQGKKNMSAYYLGKSLCSHEEQQTRPDSPFSNRSPTSPTGNTQRSFAGPKSPMRINISTSRVESSGDRSVAMPQEIFEVVQSKLGEVDTVIRELQQTKVNRIELEQALYEIVNNTSNVRNDITNFNITHNQAALQFKCLSCNKAPGQKDVQQFPPSSMFMSTKEGKGSRPSSPSAGGNMSTTKKKLVNYYEWLKGRGDENKAASGEDNQEQEPPSPTWADPPPDSSFVNIGVKPRPPHAVGSDGRFYPGVAKTGEEAPSCPPLENRAATPADQRTRKSVGFASK